MERGFLLRLQSNEASSGAPTCMHSSYATSRARRTYTGSEHRSRACTTVNLANLRMLDRSRSESSVLDIRCLQQPLRKFCDMEPLAAAYLCKCAVELCAIQSSTRSILKSSGTGTALRILATTAPRRPLLACGMSQPPQIDHSTAVCTQNVQTVTTSTRSCLKCFFTFSNLDTVHCVKVHSVSFEVASQNKRDSDKGAMMENKPRDVLMQPTVVPIQQTLRPVGDANPERIPCVRYATVLDGSLSLNRVTWRYEILQLTERPHKRFRKGTP